MLTVLTPAESVALTTVERAKSDMGVSGSTDDAYITAIIDDVSIAVASHCGRVFAREEVQETFNISKATDALPLSRWHNVDISAVTIDGEEYSPAYFEVDGSLLYKLDADGDRTEWARGKIVVTYEAGYLLPDDDDRDLPLDIERACIAIVKSSYHSRSRDPMLRSNEVEGIGSNTYDTRGYGTESGWSAEVETLLAPYRAVVFG